MTTGSEIWLESFKRSSCASSVQHPHPCALSRRESFFPSCSSRAHCPAQRRNPVRLRPLRFGSCLPSAHATTLLTHLQQRSTHKDDCGSKYCIWSNRHAQNCPHCPQCSRVRLHHHPVWRAVLIIFLFASSWGLIPKRSSRPTCLSTAIAAISGGRRTTPTAANSHSNDRPAR